jgi:hypothetical protein
MVGFLGRCDGRKAVRRAWTLAAVVITVSAAGPPAAHAQNDGLIPRRVLDPLGDCPVWTGRTEALLLWRDAPQAIPLFRDAPIDGRPVGGNVLGAESLTSGLAAGPRFTIFRHTGDNGALEFNFFRLQEFTASEAATATGPNGFVFADGVFCCPPFVEFSDVAVSLTSELQSFELNRRFPTDRRLQWLAGFRWFQWNERLDGAADIFGTDSVLGIDTATRNDLYGMQLGADSILWRPGGRFWVEGLGKAGIYYNNAGQSTFLSLDGERVLGGATDTARAAFVGELGVTSVWQITDCIAIRTGWVAFWLGGLSLGPNQLGQQCLICEDIPVTQATNTGGSVFLTGLTLGLEARW